MSSQFQKSIEAALTQVGYFAGHTVTVKRPHTPLDYTVEITAIPAKSDEEVESEFGYVDSASRDWIIKAADYVLNSVQVLPQAGDTFEDTVGSTTYIYEVFSPTSQDYFRVLDPERKYLRVFTRLI